MDRKYARVVAFCGCLVPPFAKWISLIFRRATGGYCCNSWVSVSSIVRANWIAIEDPKSVILAHETVIIHTIIAIAAHHIRPLSHLSHGQSWSPHVTVVRVKAEKLIRP